jgi:hypothetical protein
VKPDPRIGIYVWVSVVLAVAVLVVVLGFYWAAEVRTRRPVAA